MLHRFSRPMHSALAAAVLTLSSSALLAEGYGIYEPEALAMGGVAVATASPSNAVFYNPALLAQHRFDEDRGRHGRFYIPALTVQSSQAVADVYDIESDKLTDRLTSAVEQYNAGLFTDAENAAAVRDAGANLLSALNTIQGEEFYADAFAGLVIAEPGDQQGGAFYLGTRVLAEGDLTGIQDDDLNLLEDYVAGLDFIASGGQSGVANPAIFDGNGNLEDRGEDLVSTADAAGAQILELGVGLAKAFTLEGQSIAFGVTPKVMLIKAYDSQLDVSQSQIDTFEDDQWRRKLNADIGIASSIGAFNIGLAVKDVFSHTVMTPFGRELFIAPKPRLGIGYLGNNFKVGFDYDIVPIDPLSSSGQITQDWALGGEWQIRRKIALRVGYREDLQGNRGTAFSAGLGVNLGRFLMDLSYVDSDDAQAAAFQIGYKL